MGGEDAVYWKERGFTEVNEGRVRLLVPDPRLYTRPDGQPEPAWAPVFYNPVMRDNRSLTVASILAYKGWRVRAFADPLAGACPRALRVLLEAGVSSAYAADIDPLAVSVCRANKLLNGVGSELIVERNDANAFMYRLDYEGIPVDAVDLDPYGSPVYYVQAASRLLAKRGLLIMTATDLGPLEGKYPSVALRRYGAVVGKTTFSKEMAARVLVAGVARLLTPFDRSVKPLLTLYERHYLKLVLEVEHSKGAATSTAGQLGLLCVDEKGMPRGYLPLEELTRTPRKAEGEGECWRSIGPLWLGPLWDVGHVERVLEAAKREGGVPFSDKALRRLGLMAEEARVPTPYYYRLDLVHAIAGKGEMEPPQAVVERLRSMGYRASRTHFDPRGIRTDASLQELLEVLS